MIKDALVSRLPMISVTTDDPLNVGSVLSHIAGKKATRITLRPQMDALIAQYQNQVLFTFDDVDKASSLEDLYANLFKKHLSLVFVNSECSVAFRAGHLTCPPELIGDMLDALKVHPDNKIPVEIALGGLTLKEATEVCRIAVVTKKELTQKAVLQVRRAYYGSLRGLQQVSLEYGYYSVPDQLAKWVDQQGAYWRARPNSMLAPRGVLLKGAPGTGKTLGAKYLANTLGVPLYRLDMGATADKYYGETEKALMAALEQAANCSPCLLLIDEVEKFFNTKDESGVVTRVMGLLLWWLQEHQEAILTVMTTNKEEAIPAELYRSGRIDASIRMEGIPLDGLNVPGFMGNVAQAVSQAEGIPLPQTLMDNLDAVAASLLDVYSHEGDTDIPQSVLVRAVYDEIMRAVLDKQISGG